MNQKKIVYLMRGLPCCGKSTKAKKLKGEHGIVLETDEYFYTHVGNDVNKYNYDEALLPAARAWVIARYHQAIASQITPIVIDRGNSLNQLTYQLATTALKAGYEVLFVEPDSPWWLEIRELLKDKKANQIKLQQWGEKLQQRSRTEPPFHRVALKDILKIMRSWHCDLSVEDVLRHYADKE